MASTRLKGTKLSLKIDNTEHKGDLTSYEFSTSEKSENVVTFEDMENGNGGYQYTLKLGFVQSTDANSLFMKFWENTGAEANYTLAPHGNPTPSAAQPHFTGKLIIPAPPNFGGEAGDTDYTTEAECLLTGKPVKKTSNTSS